MKHLSPDRQMAKARETLDIYAPLAHRLGIYKWKWELEDLCLRYLDRDAFYELVGAISQKRSEREEYIGQIITELKGTIERMGIHCEIEGRPKHFYSIYRKMKVQNKNLDQIYDLFAARIVVDSVADCYSVLGAVHELYRPIPGRFKDYIAMPKPNMYQSLHTTVIGPRGMPFEVQIRTFAMHRTAEFGIAAHWKYKDDDKKHSGTGTTEFDEKLSWLRQLLDWQKDMRDASEYMESLKNGLIADEVFVFTPKGDVVALPAGSVPIDFAYTIHSGIGNRMYGAKVNGRIVPLT
jgi:guanosine-3',5'-bis(diphosphate) 3'-pyrophosphohydrolase